ncbi:HipA N-terminal domain protein [Kribbella flavida DSM 17836]|uniref:HipA N-terminal domain protein n=1 Tax=Kribbella flavida (strain DSM 17836 / JCM 10339 / NBRC 14399) TaxID=479435 RepID=D2PYR2_KRIFD|nr:type II toxin-antitoxin system HipA family toxin [Kribbella flavida]ADB29908.1 HipA N-terminal domain protein [Kribbella flavida DSM 17836]
MPDRLAVLLYGVVVGQLERADERSPTTFTYAENYVRTGEVALSARLPIASSTWPPSRTEPYLRGLLPENAATLGLWSSRLGTSPDDLFGILAAMGWDCPGAVQFSALDKVDELLSRSGEYELLSEFDIGQRLRDLAVRPASWTMPDEHWSLGGQQEKFALARIDGRWHAAHGSAATTHIVKPGIPVLFHQALVEHATMAAATALGVDVAASQLLRFDDQWAIVVERFDRTPNSDGTVTRIHQEDFCQALGRMPENKYESRGGPGARDMVRLLKRESTVLRDDLLALADFMIVNLVAGAPDGHAKNISLLRSAGRTWVAPLYDLATGLAYDSDQVERTVALSVGGERHPARIFSEQWDKAAKILGLDRELLRGRVGNLASSFPQAFADALKVLADVPGAAEVAGRSLPAVQAHCDLLLSRL